MPEFTATEREILTTKGQAMPSGAYPIRNRADLKRAIMAFGRAADPEKTKAWIIKRARELNAMDLLPEKWLSETEHSQMTISNDEFTAIMLDPVKLKHYGVKGMKWGVKNLDIDGDGRVDRGGKPSRVITKTSAADLPGGGGGGGDDTELVDVDGDGIPDLPGSTYTEEQYSAANPKDKAQWLSSTTRQTTVSLDGTKHTTVVKQQGFIEGVLGALFDSKKTTRGNQTTVRQGVVNKFVEDILGKITGNQSKKTSGK